MKLNRLLAFGLLSGSMLGFTCHVKADNAVPCLIFSGNSETEHRIDLNHLNRISFGQDGMTVSSSKDNEAESIELLYSLFHHMEIGDAIPSTTVEIADIAADEISRLLYRAEEKALMIEDDLDVNYSIGIFNLNGILIATSSLSPGQCLSLESLQAGMYIAVATNGVKKLTLKFNHH